jgi:hypothetical protein
MRPEIQAYFRSVAEQYRVVDHVQFHSVVERAEWDDAAKVWVVTILDLKTKQQTVRRAKILVSGVGSLSVPKECDLPGKESFQGKMFHSAQWDHSFDWQDKNVVVLGELKNYCVLILVLMSSRQRLFRNTIPPYHGEPTKSSPQNHAIRETSAIPLGAREPRL